MNIQNNKELVIFDRDGTLHQRNKMGYITNISKIVLPKDFSYLSNLDSKYFNLSLVTNQSCVNKEILSYEEVAILNEYLFGLVFQNFDYKIYICPHLESDKCKCRKPEPGLIIEAMAHFSATRFNSTFIGDSESDYYAAQNAGIGFIGVCWDSVCLGSICAHTLTGAIDRLLENRIV